MFDTTATCRLTVFNLYLWVNFLSINWVLRLQYMCNTLNSTLSYNIFYCLDQTECESTRSNEWGEPCEV